MTPTRRLSLLAGATMAVLAGALSMTAMPALAIPPGGPSPDTPGTSASVSPATLEACQTIEFTVTGFPAGETLYVKIDDGIGYGDTSVQGEGVWHMQSIPASGTVHGRRALPCDIAPGAHWLRFLASEEILDEEGNFQGVIGYTSRGTSDFTVVAPSGSQDSGSGSGSGSSGSSGSSGDSGSSGGSGSGSGSGNGTQSGSGQSGDSSDSGDGTGEVPTEGEVVAVDPEAVAAAGSDGPPAESPEPPAVSGDDLPGDLAGLISVTAAGDFAVIDLSADRAGQWVYVYAHAGSAGQGGQAPDEQAQGWQGLGWQGLGWQQVGDQGHVTISTLTMDPGEHRFAVLDADGDLIGWSAAQLGEAPVDQGETDTDSPDSPDEAVVPISASGAVDDSRFPVIGVVGAVVLVLVGAGAAWLVLRGSGRARAGDDVQVGEDAQVGESAGVDGGREAGAPGGDVA